MDNSIFKKMRLKPNLSAMVLFAPKNYPASDEFAWVDAGQADFVHLLDLKAVCDYKADYC